MLVPSAETDFVGDFRRKTYHLHFTFYVIKCQWNVSLRRYAGQDALHVVFY